MEERKSGKTKNDEDMDPLVLKELIKQRRILNNLEQQRFINPKEKRFRGMPSGEYTRLANGGSPEQEFVNQRIAELMMEEPVNEMRATNPDMFERQKLGIERLLSNLYEPRRARDIAETISTGMDFTPLGDPAALAEGFQMMGDDQPLMGAALMAGSVFTNMPANKLKKLITETKDKLKNDIPQRIYDARNFMRQTSQGDQFQGQRMMKKASEEKRKLTKELAEMEDALANPELPLDPSPKSGIINATPEINKLFREISESPSRINTPQHQEAAKLTGEQLRKINRGIEKLEPTERDRVAELIQKLLEDR